MVLQQGKDIYVLLWMGDRIVNTLFIMLTDAGFKADAFADVIEIENAQATEVIACLEQFMENVPPTNTILAKLASNKSSEKYDDWLPEELLFEGYGEKTFDVKGTIEWLQKNLVP